jgi:hypothetical protein
MKKIMILLVIILTLSFGSILSADNFGKQNYAGINPFGLLIHYYSGDFGHYLDSKGSTEVNIPIGYFSYGDYTYFSIGGKYRLYKDKNAEGIFYGAGLIYSHYGWDFNWLTDNKSLSWNVFTPIVEGGYRWSWANGWTVAPSLELGYDISNYDDSDDWSKPTYGDGGISWGLNLGVGYMF